MPRSGCAGLDAVITSDHTGIVTASELRRKLGKLGCQFEDATNHTKVIYRGRVSFIPRHPSVEIKKGTLHGILKKLGIDRL